MSKNTLIRTKLTSYDQILKMLKILTKTNKIPNLT